MVGAFIGAIDPRLDVVALTNHAQKPVTFTQHRMVEQLRQGWSGLVLAGIEWNAPRGRHACVLAPPADDEADRLYELARRFDRRLQGSTPDVAASLDLLGGVPLAQRPVLHFNHPAPGQWSSEAIAEYRRHDPGGIVCGIETVHGHQAYAAVAAFDPETYPGSSPGGLPDVVGLEGTRFGLFANSDFHVHKQDRQFDYGPGVFNHTLVGVPAGDASPATLFAALRAGRTCAAQGHWLDLHDLRLETTGAADSDTVARLGDTWCGVGTATAELETREPLRRLDWIGSLDGAAPDILAAHGPLAAGTHRVELSVPAGATGFVRLRALSASVERPAPGPQGPKGFFTSAILLQP